MVRAKIAFVALLLALPVALPGTLQAHEFTAATRLTAFKVPNNGTVAPGTALVIHGRLKSVQQTCRFDRVVKLMRVRNTRPDRVLARTTTNRQGQYMFLRRPYRTQRVYVAFDGLDENVSGHRHVCKPSRTKVLRIEVSA